MAIKNENLYQFRLTEADKEIREVFDEISDKLYNGRDEVKIKDVLRVLVRSYRPNDSLVIPSQKTLLEGIRELLQQHAYLRRDSDSLQALYETENVELYDELDGLLDQFGVETDD